MKRILTIAAVVALTTFGAAAPADAKPTTTKVVVHKARVCYTANGVKRCHVQQVRTVHRAVTR